MSFMVAAATVLGTVGAVGIGTTMLAGAMMGAALSGIGNIISGRDVFYKMGKGIFLGAATAGVAQGMGSFGSAVEGTAGAAGAAGGSGAAVSSSTSFWQNTLQGLSDYTNLPWEVIQALPGAANAAGTASLMSAIQAAADGKDPFEAAIKGGAYGFVGNTLSSSFANAGVNRAVSNVASQAAVQAIRNGKLDAKSLATSAALNQINPELTKILGDAGVPKSLLPMVVGSFNQVLFTGEVDANKLVMQTAGQFVRQGPYSWNAVKGDLKDTPTKAPVEDRVADLIKVADLSKFADTTTDGGQEMTPEENELYTWAKENNVLNDKYGIDWDKFNSKFSLTPTDTDTTISEKPKNDKLDAQLEPLYKKQEEENTRYQDALEAYQNADSINAKAQEKYDQAVGDYNYRKSQFETPVTNNSDNEFGFSSVQRGDEDNPTIYIDSKGGSYIRVRNGDDTEFKRIDSAFPEEPPAPPQLVSKDDLLNNLIDASEKVIGTGNTIYGLWGISETPKETIDEYNNLDAELKKATDTLNTYDARKAEFETPVKTGADNQFGLDVVQQGSEDEIQVLRDARGAFYTPYRNGEDTGFRRIDSAFPEDKEQIQANIKSIEDKMAGISAKTPGIDVIAGTYRTTPPDVLDNLLNSGKDPSLVDIVNPPVDTPAQTETTPITNVTEPKATEPTPVYVVSVDPETNTAVVVDTVTGDVKTVPVDPSTVNEGDTVNIDSKTDTIVSPAETITETPATRNIADKTTEETLTPEQQWAKNNGVLNANGTIDWTSYDIDSGVGTGSTGPEQTEQEVRDQLGTYFDLVYPNGYPGKDVPELPEVKATFDDEEPDNWDPSLMGDWSTFNKPEPPDNWDPELMGDWSKLNPEERSTAVGGTKGTGGGIKTPTVKPPTPPVKPPVTPTVKPTTPAAPVAAAAASPFMTVSDLNKPVDIKYYTDMASQGILPQQPETNAAQFKLEKDRAEKEKEAENSGEGDFAYGGLINGYDDEFTIEDLLNMLRS